MTNTTVTAGHSVSNLDVLNGDSLDVQSGGTVNNTTIETGGFVAIESSGGFLGSTAAGIANGTTVHNGAILDLRGTATASNVVLDGGTLEVDSTASVTKSLTFGPTTGTQDAIVILTVNDGSFKPTITGFSASSAIADDAVHFPGAKLSTTVVNGNTTATLTGNGVTNTFTFAGTPQLTIVPDNGDDSGPEAVIVTTNTTTPFAPVSSNGVQGQQASVIGGQQEQASGQSPGALPALQAHPAAAVTGALTLPQNGALGGAVMRFLSQPQGAASAEGNPFGSGTSGARLAQAAAGVAAGARAIISTAHELTLPQNQGLGSAILGVLSQPHSPGVGNSMAGLLSNTTGATGVEALAAIGSSGGALIGAFGHATMAAVTPVTLHHVG